MPPVTTSASATASSTRGERPTLIPRMRAPVEPRRHERGGRDYVSCASPSVGSTSRAEPSATSASDAHDHERDREADQRVGDVEPERDDCGARHDGQADVCVGARVVAVGDQRRAVEPPAARVRMPAAIQLPAKPRAPAAARAPRCSGSRGSISRSTDSAPATHALTKIASDHGQAAQRSARALRSANAIASGKAVAASPKLWISRRAARRCPRRRTRRSARSRSARGPAAPSRRRASPRGTLDRRDRRARGCAHGARRRVAPLSRPARLGRVGPAARGVLEVVAGLGQQHRDVRVVQA